MKLPQLPTFRLDGKRALVTGASRGIGMGAAAALASAGAHVVLAARNEQELKEVEKAIISEGGSAEVLPIDVTDTREVKEAIRAQPVFDVLVNNAGVNRPGPMLSMQEQDFDTVMDVNVRAAYFVAQAVVEVMLEFVPDEHQASRSIIHTSSQMGHVGGLDRTVYCTSKHAIEGLTKAMAVELGEHNIRVNSICPTFISTPLTQSTLADPEKVAWIKSKIKLQRIGEIEDVMGAVVFLASDAASLITGAALMIDGGWTAG